LPSRLARDHGDERENERTAKRDRENACLRVFPALVVDLVHVAVAFVVGVLRFDVEYLGLIQELEVEAEHFLILRVLGVVSL